MFTPGVDQWHPIGYKKDGISWSQLSGKDNAFANYRKIASRMIGHD
jgi:hypothetical protein